MSRASLFPAGPSYRCVACRRIYSGARLLCHKCIGVEPVRPVTPRSEYMLEVMRLLNPRIIAMTEGEEQAP